ncbi:hypothetical protein QQP08_022810 [Theobroma cacao]|nr:hypothetical protein QQP08_022810 [Theobroma cacao]
MYFDEEEEYSPLMNSFSRFNSPSCCSTTARTTSTIETMPTIFPSMTGTCRITSATVMFSNPFSCVPNGEGEEVTHPKRENMFFPSMEILPSEFFKIESLTVSWHDLSPRISPCILAL